MGQAGQIGGAGDTRVRHTILIYFRYSNPILHNKTFTEKDSPYSSVLTT